nr:hypothetical protein Iba_chr07aCG7300 [Ipomoea batatas]
MPARRVGVDGCLLSVVARYSLTSPEEKPLQKTIGSCWARFTTALPELHLARSWQPSEIEEVENVSADAVENVNRSFTTERAEEKLLGSGKIASGCDIDTLLSLRPAYRRAYCLDASPRSREGKYEQKLATITVAAPGMVLDKGFITAPNALRPSRGNVALGAKKAAAGKGPSGSSGPTVPTTVPLEIPSRSATPSDLHVTHTQGRWAVEQEAATAKRAAEEATNRMKDVDSLARFLCQDRAIAEAFFRAFIRTDLGDELIEEVENVSADAVENVNRSFTAERAEEKLLGSGKIASGCDIDTLLSLRPAYRRAYCLDASPRRLITPPNALPHLGQRWGPGSKKTGAGKGPSDSSGPTIPTTVPLEIPSRSTTALTSIFTHTQGPGGDKVPSMETIREMVEEQSGKNCSGPRRTAGQSFGKHQEKGGEPPKKLVTASGLRIKDFKIRAYSCRAGKLRGEAGAEEAKNQNEGPFVTHGKLQSTKGSDELRAVSNSSTADSAAAATWSTPAAGRDGFANLRWKPTELSLPFTASRARRCKVAERLGGTPLSVTAQGSRNGEAQRSPLLRRQPVSSSPASRSNGGVLGGNGDAMVAKRDLEVVGLF